MVANFTSGTAVTGLTNGDTYYFRLYTYNAKGREAASEAYSATPTGVTIVTWANGSDEDIAKMLEDHYNNKLNISDYWSVGDERVIHLDAMGGWQVGAEMIARDGETHAAQDVTFVILGFDHDNLGTPVNGHTKAAVSVQMKDVLETAGMIDYDYYIHYQNKDSYRQSWKWCNRRAEWINSIFKNAIPETIRGAIKTVKKVTYAYEANYTDSDGWNKSYEKQITEDDCYLLSCKETGTGTVGNYYKEEGTLYEYYRTSSNRVKYRPSDHSAQKWWVRSLGDSFSYYWRCITKDGSTVTTGSNSNNWLAVGFSL